MSNAAIAFPLCSRTASMYAKLEGDPLEQVEKLEAVISRTLRRLIDGEGSDTDCYELAYIAREFLDQGSDDKELETLFHHLRTGGDWEWAKTFAKANEQLSVFDSTTWVITDILKEMAGTNGEV